MPLKMNITLSKDSKSFSTIKARLFISKSSNQNSHHCIKMVRFLQLVIVTTPNECSLDFFFFKGRKGPRTTLCYHQSLGSWVHCFTAPHRCPPAQIITPNPHYTCFLFFPLPDCTHSSPYLSYLQLYCYLSPSPSSPIEL